MNERIIELIKKKLIKAELNEGVIEVSFKNFKVYLFFMFFSENKIRVYSSMNPINGRLKDIVFGNEFDLENKLIHLMDNLIIIDAIYEKLFWK